MKVIKQEEQDRTLFCDVCGCQTHILIALVDTATTKESVRSCEACHDIAYCPPVL